MQCLTCGTALQPGMSACPRCGTPAPLSTAGNDDPTIPADFGPFRENAYAPPGSFPGGMPPQNVYHAGIAPPGTWPANESGPAYGPYAGQFYAANPPSYVPPPPPAPQPPLRPRRGLSKGLLFLLSILVLLMIVGGGIIFYFSVPYPAQIRAQATATAQTRANTIASATAQTIHNENATATAQAQATLTAQQNIYAQATNGIPTITDSLAKNSSLQWDEYDSANNGGCVFTGGMYHVKELDTGYFQTCFSQANNLSNFTLQVQMTILSGEYGGIVFRADGQNSKFYLLQVGASGSYELFTYFNNSGNTSKTLLSSYSQAIKGQNLPNLLTLIARGNQLTLFVNKQYVDTVSDNTYKTGQMGLVAYDKSIPADAVFSNLQIWKL